MKKSFCATDIQCSLDKGLWNWYATPRRTPRLTPLSVSHTYGGISHMTFNNLWRKKRCLISHPTETTPGFSARYRDVSRLFPLPLISPDVWVKVSSGGRLTVKERKCERGIHQPRPRTGRVFEAEGELSVWCRRGKTKCVCLYCTCQLLDSGSGSQTIFSSSHQY